jgi:hypothetical protein
MGISCFRMRQDAAAAVFDAFIGIFEGTSASASEGIKGTIAEEAVESASVFRFMAGEILTFPVPEKSV